MTPPNLCSTSCSNLFNSLNSAKVRVACDSSCDSSLPAIGWYGGNNFSHKYYKFNYYNYLFI